jgi:hypothetical protein
VALLETLTRGAGAHRREPVEGLRKEDGSPGMPYSESKSAAPRYRPLRGKKSCVGMGYYKLYLAEDHLLQIYSRFGVEDSQRFYLSDIQAVVVARTRRGAVTTLVLLGLAALAALGVAATEWGAAVFGPPLILLAALAVVNVLRGPTCLATITTAVQTERLHSLHRLRNALRFMDTLRPAALRFQKETAARAARPASGMQAARGPGRLPAARRSP